MSRKVQWVNPYLTEVYMVKPGTLLPVGMAEDGGALVIEHDDDLMICMDSPLDVREFLIQTLLKVNRYINEHKEELY